MSMNEWMNFFYWCSVINFGMMLVSLVFVLTAKEMVYKMHGKLFNLTKECLSQEIYHFLGIYKIFFIVFNLVPFIALKLMIA